MAYTQYIGWPDWQLGIYTYVHAQYFFTIGTLILYKLSIITSSFYKKIKMYYALYGLYMVCLWMYFVSMSASSN